MFFSVGFFQNGFLFKSIHKLLFEDGFDNGFDEDTYSNLRIKDVFIKGLSTKFKGTFQILFL